MTPDRWRTEPGDDEVVGLIQGDDDGPRQDQDVQWPDHRRGPGFGRFLYGV